MAIGFGVADPDALRPRGRRARLGRHHRLAVGIVVETLAGLAPEDAGIKTAAHQLRRAIARLVIALLVDGDARRLAHVEAGELHQLERAHAKARDVAHDAVDVDEARDAFGSDMRRFHAEAAPDLVDDEARRILHPHRLASHAPAYFHQRVAHLGRGAHAVDHFDQLHQRHRVEKMHAGETLGPLQLCGDGGHGERRSVGGEDAVLADDALELGEQGLLRREVLDDDLDHEVAGRHRRGAVDHLDPAHGRRMRLLREAALLHRALEHLGDEGLGLRRRARARIGHPHAHAAGRGDLGDAAPHGAGADDAQGEITAFRIELHGGSR